MQCRKCIEATLTIVLFSLYTLLFSIIVVPTSAAVNDDTDSDNKRCSDIKQIMISPDTDILHNTQEQDVSISINNNTGIMGFKLHFEYDTSHIEIVSVARGNVTSIGMFQDNIGLKPNEFDLLWNHVENVYGDGSIAVIRLRVLTNDSCKIDISYSQPDTFNEEWNDVVLQCLPLKTLDVTTTVVQQSQTTALLEQTETTAVISTATQVDKKPVTIVTDVLQKHEIDSIENLTDVQKEQLYNEIQTEYEFITGEKLGHTDFDSLICDYQNELKSELKNELESGEKEQYIEQIIADEIEKAPNGQLTPEAVGDINEELKSIGVDDRYFRYVSDDDLIDVYTSLTESNTLVAVMVAAVITVSVLIALIVFVKGRKRNDKA